MSDTLPHPQPSADTSTADSLADSSLGDTSQPTRSQLNAALHERAESAIPINSVGEAGSGAAKIARNIQRAHNFAPTEGRASAQRAYAQGAEGELEVAEQLKWLPGSDFWVLHDQPWPGRPKANIDHIVVGRTGVFVVDAKNWSGKITLSHEGIRQNGALRPDTIPSLLNQASALTALIHRLPISDPQAVRVTPILAFCGKDVPEGQHSGVFVRPAHALAKSIGEAPDNIRSEYVRLIAQELEASLKRDRANSLKQHSLNVKAFRARQAEQPTTRSAARPQNTRKAASNSTNTRARSGKTTRTRKRTNPVALVLSLGFLAVVFLKPELLGACAQWLVQFLTSTLGAGS